LAENEIHPSEPDAGKMATGGQGGSVRIFIGILVYSWRAALAFFAAFLV